MGCTDSKTMAIPSASAVPNQIINQPKSSATNLVNGSNYQTVVIGAGIAGITAAAELAKKGQKVAVLEANGYIGGRLKSTPIKLTSGGFLQFDEGASWIHGSCNKHPITKLSKQVQGLVMKQTIDDRVEYYDQKGQDVEKQADKAQKVFQKLLQRCDEWEPQYSMQQALKKQKPGVLNDKFFMFHISNDTEFQTSGSIKNLAANTFDDDEFDGKEMLILSGYQRFAQTIAKQEQIEVYLQQKVRAVIQNEGRSQIVCSNGVSIYAKNVIIAVPIGVLKANAIKFEPQLPGWKQQAIQSIGFGNVCKILIDFPNKKLFDVKSHYIGVVSDNVNERGLATYYLNLQAVAGVPAMMTFGLGDNADQAERMPEAQLKLLIAKRLSTFSQQKISPEDFRIYRTVWKGNQNFLGTYSYASTQTRPKHWMNIAKPIFHSRWYFCGEHTTSKYRGSVHGAYLSGIHTAKWLTNELNEQNWKYPDFKKNKKQESSSSSS